MCVWLAARREKVTSTRLLTLTTTVVKGYTWDLGWMLDTRALLGKGLQRHYKSSQVTYLKGMEWEGCSADIL